jgi:hypothetical protein
VLTGLAGSLTAPLLLAAPITRDGAQQDAHRELQRGIYDEAQPTLLARVVEKVLDFVRSVLHHAANATPGGAFGLLTLVVLLVLAGFVVFRLGPLRRPRSASGGLDAPAAVTAEQLRAQAESFAAQQQWADAVRARLRAVVRRLEDRTVIEPRPGRTAYEVARDAAAVAPTLRPLLEQAAETFGEVWYGGRDATETDYRVMVELDEAVRTFRPGVGEPPVPTGPAVPA